MMMYTPIATLSRGKNDQLIKEISQPDPIRLRHFRTGPLRHFALPVQQNNCFMITWFIKGNGILTVDFSSHVVETDSLFFIEPHTVYSLDTPQKTELEGWHLS